MRCRHAPEHTKAIFKIKIIAQITKLKENDTEYL